MWVKMESRNVWFRHLDSAGMLLFMTFTAVRPLVLCLMLSSPDVWCPSWFIGIKLAPTENQSCADLDDFYFAMCYLITWKMMCSLMNCIWCKRRWTYIPYLPVLTLQSHLGHNKWFTVQTDGTCPADATWSLSQVTSWGIFPVFSVRGAHRSVAKEQWKKPNEAGNEMALQTWVIIHRC